MEVRAEVAVAAEAELEDELEVAVVWEVNIETIKKMMDIIIMEEVVGGVDMETIKKMTDTIIMKEVVDGVDMEIIKKMMDTTTTAEVVGEAEVGVIVVWNMKGAVAGAGVVGEDMVGGEEEQDIVEGVECTRLNL